KNHDEKLEIGYSDTPMPLHFTFDTQQHIESTLTPEQFSKLPNYFDLPDLRQIDDSVVNGDYYETHPGKPGPLALFDAPRVDISLYRLAHYTATSAEHFQNYVLFTNYQFYIDEFIRFAHETLSATDNPD